MIKITYQYVLHRALGEDIILVRIPNIDMNDDVINQLRSKIKAIIKIECDIVFVSINANGKTVYNAVDENIAKDLIAQNLDIDTIFRFVDNADNIGFSI